MSYPQNILEVQGPGCTILWPLPGPRVDGTEPNEKTGRRTCAAEDCYSFLPVAADFTEHDAETWQHFDVRVCRQCKSENWVDVTEDWR